MGIFKKAEKTQFILIFFALLRFGIWPKKSVNQFIKEPWPNICTVQML